MTPEPSLSSPTQSAVETWPGFFRKVFARRGRVLLGIFAAMAVALYAVLAQSHRIPVWSTADFKDADAYCRELTVQASALGDLHTLGAIVLGCIVVLGGMVQLASDSDKWDGRRPLLYASAVSAILCTYLFMRASAANQLASAANDARAGDIDAVTMLQVCTKTRGAWILSRNDANAIAKAAIVESSEGKTETAQNAARMTRSELHDRVAAVTDGTSSSLEDTSRAIEDNANAVRRLADGLPAPTPSASGAVAAARDLAASAASGARSAREKAGIARSVAKQGFPRSPDAGAP